MQALKLLSLASAALLAFNASADMARDEDTGCLVEVLNVRVGDSTTWAGDCVDGKAQGQGALKSTVGAVPQGEFRAGKPYNATGREVIVRDDGSRWIDGATYKDGQGTRYELNGPQQVFQLFAAGVKSRIRPLIVYANETEGNPVALVEIKTEPTGRIVAFSLKESSGVEAWDRAVLRAVEKAESLPLDDNGNIPPVITIAFQPKV